MIERVSFKLSVYRMEAIPIVMTIRDKRTGAGVDLTGATLTFTVRDTLDVVTFLIQKTTGSGIVHDPDQVANPGKFTLTLGTGDTTLPVDDYFWDLFRDDLLEVEPSKFSILRSARYGPA